MTIWEQLLPLTVQLHGRVLDVGCNVGTYVTRLSMLPGITEVVGVDVQRFSDWDLTVDERLAKWGYSGKDCSHVATTSFVQADVGSELGRLGSGFDCTMAWHIVEHMPDSQRGKALLTGLAEIVDDMLCVAMPQGFTTADPTHCFGWSVDECKAALEQSGWHVVESIIDSCKCQNHLAVRI